MATLRIFVDPGLHELIIRYLEPDDIQGCVESVVPLIKKRRS